MAADWVSAGADVFAAIGTVGAFATAFNVYARTRNAERVNDLRGVEAIWAHKNIKISHDDLESRFAQIVESIDGVNFVLTPRHIPVIGPREFTQYSLHLRNNSQGQIFESRLFIYPTYGRFSRRDVKKTPELTDLSNPFVVEIIPVAGNVSASMDVITTPHWLIQFDIHRPIHPGESLEVAHFASPLVSSPRRPIVSFIDDAGQEWAISSEGKFIRGAPERIIHGRYWRFANPGRGFHLGPEFGDF